MQHFRLMALATLPLVALMATPAHANCMRGDNRPECGSTQGTNDIDLVARNVERQFNEETSRIEGINDGRNAAYRGAVDDRNEGIQNAVDDYDAAEAAQKQAKEDFKNASNRHERREALRDLARATADKWEAVKDWYKANKVPIPSKPSLLDLPDNPDTNNNSDGGNASSSKDNDNPGNQTNPGVKNGPV